MYGLRGFNIDLGDGQLDLYSSYIHTAVKTPRRTYPEA
jgi:hypothetical protein